LFGRRKRFFEDFFKKETSFQQNGKKIAEDASRQGPLL
jgi:hypothetical protein